MPMHKIEIDDEVFSYLENKAKPFVDTTPNAVLRRVLLGNNSASATGSTQLIPELPRGTPKSLEHVLQVVYLIRAKNYDRSEATNAVARHHGITTQTVIDQYTRQLRLNARDFNGLLTAPDPSTIRAYLNTIFMEYESLIAKYIE
jgi:hypothetical protein